MKMKFNGARLKKHFVTICSLLVFSAYSQDKIVLLNGGEILGRITEITDQEIKYKIGAPENTILRSVSTAEVFMVVYENGTKEVFDKPPALLPGDQEKRDPKSPETHVRFGGPRIGITFISAGTLAERLDRIGKKPTITQFGWQFEKRLFSFENGPHGMIEFVPLIGGVEQGIFLPSASLLIGVRGGKNGAFELALGPNVSVAGFGMVFAIGTNYHYRNVNFPVNLAFVPSVTSKRFEYDPVTGGQKESLEHTGHRITLIVGFNVRKR